MYDILVSVKKPSSGEENPWEYSILEHQTGAGEQFVPLAYMAKFRPKGMCFCSQTPVVPLARHTTHQTLRQRIDGRVPKQGQGVLLIRGLPHAMDLPYPASNHVSHPVPYPLVGREKAMACGSPPWSGTRPDSAGPVPRESSNNPAVTMDPVCTKCTTVRMGNVYVYLCMYRSAWVLGIMHVSGCGRRCRCMCMCIECATSLHCIPFHVCVFCICAHPCIPLPFHAHSRI